MYSLKTQCQSHMMLLIIDDYCVNNKTSKEGTGSVVTKLVQHSSARPQQQLQEAIDFNSSRQTERLRGQPKVRGTSYQIPLKRDCLDLNRFGTCATDEGEIIFHCAAWFNRVYK